MKKKLLGCIALTAVLSLTAQAELIGANLDFEDGNTIWTVTSTGTSAIGAFGSEFRTAGAEANWFGSGTDLLMDMNPASTEAGILSQALTGVAEEGTYTWTISDIGLANFGDNGGGVMTYGFSLDGSTFIAGSSATVTEGLTYFSPNTGSAANDVLTYAASGSESALYVMFETGVGDAVRTVSTVGSTALAFEAIPEPATLVMVAVFGGGLLFIRRKLMM